MKLTIAHSRSLPSIFPALTFGALCLFSFLLTDTLRASDLPVAVTLQLPVPPSAAMPVWLGHPETPPAAFATLDLPIMTPDPAASLLVTVYFQEKQEGFLRVAWKGTQGSQMLSDNFYENIGMANQRSLLIAPSTLLGDGILSFQSSDGTLGIQRIKLEWLETKSSLVSPEVQDLLVAPALGSTQLALDLNGQTNPTEPAFWQGQLITVPLTDQAVRIEQGVEFSIDLDRVPGSARLALKETGLPLGRHFDVWINQQRAGTITPTVPDLLDDGYAATTAAPDTYVGWRDGSFYVPVSLLKEGENSILFSPAADEEIAPVTTTPSADENATPLAVKALVLQLNYLPAPPKTDGSQPAASTPSGPITSSESTTTLPFFTTP